MEAPELVVDDYIRVKKDAFVSTNHEAMGRIDEVFRNRRGLDQYLYTITFIYGIADDKRNPDMEWGFDLEKVPAEEVFMKRLSE